MTEIILTPHFWNTLTHGFPVFGQTEQYPPSANTPVNPGTLLRYLEKDLPINCTNKEPDKKNTAPPPSKCSSFSSFLPPPPPPVWCRPIHSTRSRLVNIACAIEECLLFWQRRRPHPIAPWEAASIAMLDFEDIFVMLACRVISPQTSIIILIIRTRKVNVSTASVIRFAW